MICDYERHVLSCIAFDNKPEDPGAAWWAACEALAGRKLISKGKITEAGRKALIAT